MKAKRFMAAAMAAMMSVGLVAGCSSSSDSSSDASDSSSGISAGTYSYRKTVINEDEVDTPAYNFAGDTLLSTYCNATSVELTLEDDGTFSMEYKAWMTGSDDGTGEEPEANEYGSSMYAEVTTTATGTYETDGDQVTITAEVVTTEIPDMGISYMAQLFTGGNAANGSFNDEGEDYYGEWSSEDIEEVLELVPDTIFTIDGDTIVTWERADTLTSVVTDVARVYFCSDGTVIYQDLENDLTESAMTWTCDGETFTVTDASGNVYTGSADTALELSILSYTDSTSYNTYTQSIELSEENIAALS